MIHKTNETETKSSYISCIKIGGVPILPPLITPERRKQLLEYKKQAIKIEKRLNREKELREYINHFYLADTSQVATPNPIKQKLLQSESVKIPLQDERDQKNEQPKLETFQRGTTPHVESPTSGQAYNEYKNHLVPELSDTLEHFQLSPASPDVCHLKNSHLETIEGSVVPRDILQKLYSSPTFPENDSNYSVFSTQECYVDNSSPKTVCRMTPYSRTLEHQLVFGDESSESSPRNFNKDVGTPANFKKLNSNCNVEGFEYKNDQNLGPECNNDFIESDVIRNDSPEDNKSSDFDSLNVETIIETTLQKKTKEDPSQENKRSEVTNSPRPKLLRSNSYTLESPSPILLAHLQNHNTFSNDVPLEYRNKTPVKQASPMRNCMSLDDDKFSEKFGSSRVSIEVTRSSPPRPNSPAKVPNQGRDIIAYASEISNLCLANLLNSDGAMPKSKSSSLENVQSPTVPSKSEISSSANVVTSKQYNSPQVTTSPKCILDTFMPVKIAPSNKLTEKSLQQNPVTVNKDLQDVIKNNFPARILDNRTKEEPDENVDVEEQLQQILDKLPENYSKKILDLLDKQKWEMQKRMENSGEGPFRNCGSQQLRRSTSCENAKNIRGVHIPPSYSTPLDLSPTYIENSTKSDYITSSQSIYYTMCSSTDTLNALQSPNSQCVDADYRNDANLGDNEVFQNGKMASEMGKDCDDCALKCNRELFPIRDIKSAEIVKKENAASKIGAAVKGYLTRRLMRTDRVQSLIATIKEALICAMELHSEDHDRIQPADVELHRRLIQQVSAACFEFHEVFFGLPVQEQMMVISQDRQRQLEKLKRPPSSGSRKSSSSRSSSRSRSTPRSSKTSLTTRKPSKELKI